MKSFRPWVTPITIGSLVLLKARISTLAELTARTPQQLRDSLGRRGILITSDEVTLADAARRSQVNVVRALEAVLQDN